ncbi:ADP-ribosylglycohydrolase family protein [Microbispora sp. ATCC PTA-5024]|uniref:ADP-ribosylglycohydrolase family protein n=1 Tax=Microbispora sp. ATCC PTA-5024 TaxID=316330 RepID=UPI0003DCA519|nr:ADP-ribosylglycohydrolase family protein [Microbispora sp. ATCC PTA-5024]ETK36594.1 ADP-ribosylglycohydrolase [Microbispora sp. ATCC PTA-5024]
MGYYSRVMGCMLGGAIGDALGNPFEFMSLSQIRAAHGPDGLRDMVSTEVTDDTQMTLFTAEGLIRARLHGSDPVAAVWGAYLRWLDTQQFPGPPAPDDRARNGWLRQENWLYARRAPGTACLSGVSAGGRHLEVPAPGSIGAINPMSKGCGSVMRSAPFGLTGVDPFETAARCSYLTHGHPTASLSAGAFAAIIHDLVRGGSLRHAVEQALGRLTGCPAHQETVGALRAAVHLASGSKPTAEAVESLGAGWIAEEALAMAVYCALAEPDPREALLLAVNHSGDSDSTGAICGNILGAQQGLRALPADWLNGVEGRQTIVEITYDLLAEPTSHSYWTDRYPS